ncbi:MAG: L,D-transpeptidase family protein [Sphingomonadaceae bacterium]|nr:L,D-transpeptidase family protein [Sphingomonadaceae bacterium]
MRRLVLPLLLAIAACAPVQHAPEPLGIADYIRVDKSDRTLTLYRGERAIRTYSGIALGDAPEGHKQFEGDEKTPEGRYIIDTRNPNSAYYLSLRISYPNAHDRAFAEGQGLSPGGDIFIHGQPNGMTTGRIQGDWTDGCIAVSNAEMDELWAAVPDGTPIEITP